MKKMHGFIAAVAAIGLSGSIAFATTQGDGEGHGWHHGRGHMEARLAQKLNLTDAQKTQWKTERKAFYEANKATFDQFKALHKEMHAAKEANDTAKLATLKATMQSQKAQMKQLRDTEQQKFAALLTPDQLTQYNQLKADRAARRAQHEASEQHEKQ